MVSRSGETDTAIEEMAHLWALSLEDAVRWGGYLRNYRAVAQYFTVFRSPRVNAVDDFDVARRLFDHVVELGFLFSYEGNRRLKDAELLGRLRRQAGGFVDFDEALKGVQLRATAV